MKTRHIVVVAIGLLMLAGCASTPKIAETQNVPTLANRASACHAPVKDYTIVVDKNGNRWFCFGNATNIDSILDSTNSNPVSPLDWAFYKNLYLLAK